MNIFKELWAVKRSVFSKIIDGTILAAAEEYKRDEPIKGIEVKKISENIALIDVQGILFSGGGLWADLFNLQTIETIKDQFIEAMVDDDVKGIMFNINSPGGEVTGISELSDLIFESRGHKPIVAYVSGDAASAAYWIASAADQIVVNKTGFVGSIGVLSSYPVEGEAGYINIVSNQSPRKVVDVSTEEGIQQVQNHVDQLANIFIADVARNRGVSEETVVMDFGQGDVFLGGQAVTRRMADAVGNMAEALEFIKKNTGAIMEEENKVEEEAVAGPVVVEEEEVPEGTESAEITKDWLAENMPSLYDEIKEEGRQEEMQRQEMLDDTEVDEESEEEMAVLAAAKKDSKVTAEKLAFNIMKTRKEVNAKRIAKIEADRTADSEKIPQVAAADMDTKKASILSNVIAGINERRKVK